MRAATAFSVLALAGSTLAHPAPAVVENVHVVYETVIHTVYATEGQAKPTPVAEAANNVVYETQVAYETTYDAYFPPAAKPTKEPSKPTKEPAKPTEKPAETYAPPPAQPTYEAPAPEPTSEAPAPKPTQPASSGDYMDVVNEWREKLQLAPLKRWSKLESNALDCVTKGNGEMKHLLNPDTNGQVLAPGEAGIEGFTKVFVGGWLCEIPTLTGLNGICTEMSKGWAYMGQTGHAEILTDKSYKSIGCALKQGIWACDLSSKEGDN